MDFRIDWTTCTSVNIKGIGISQVLLNKFSIKDLNLYLGVEIDWIFNYNLL